MIRAVPFKGEDSHPVFKSKAALAALIPLGIAACSTPNGQITDIGITATRSACPAVAIPAATGDITLFNPEGSRDASAIDVVANITNVRATCTGEGTGQIVTEVTFDVQARRSDSRGARTVTLPYFAAIVQGSTNIVAKRVRPVTLTFADGAYRTNTAAAATSRVSRTAATLPDDVRRQITRERRPGAADAAIDPMSDPAVRAAVERAKFEVMLGFELTPDQLRYNATR